MCRRGNHTLLAAIDGLGHGPEAAHAAECARGVLENNTDTNLELLIILCHHALLTTRGAAITLAVVHHPTATMEWASIGNVEGAIVRGNHPSADLETVFHFAGVAGHRLPTFHVPRITLAAGDTLVFATDGIATSFLDDLGALDPVGPAANRIVERHARPDDDALVLVAHYTGVDTTS